MSKFNCAFVFVGFSVLAACGEAPEIKIAKQSIEKNLRDPSSVQYRNAKIISANEAERIGVEVNKNHECNKSRSLDEIYRCKIRNPGYMSATGIVASTSEDVKKLLSKNSIKIVCLEYNSKNSMGGYVGFQQEVCRVEDGRADCLGMFLSAIGNKLGDSELLVFKDADMACK